MKEYRPFRFWCQKVLPLVYDDSLSYYELLCKLVNYVNSLTSDVKALSEMVEQYENYFDNLDVQDEINNKLDAMVLDGSLQRAFIGYVYATPKMYGVIEDDDITTQLQAAINANYKGSVDLKEGDYYIHDTIVIDNANGYINLSLNGCTLHWTGGNAPMFIIRNSNLSYLRVQSSTTIRGGVLDCAGTATTGILDLNNFTIVNGLTVLDAQIAGLTLGSESETGAVSMASRYSNIVVNRVNETWGEGFGIAVYKSDIMFSNIFINRHRIGFLMRTGGHRVVNAHIVAQLKTEQVTAELAESYGFYFGPYYGDGHNVTAISNCYFDTVKYCVFFAGSNNPILLDNSFYLADVGQVTGDKLTAYVGGGITNANITIRNFGVAQNSKLDLKDIFLNANLSYFDPPANHQEYITTPNVGYGEIIEAVNLNNYSKKGRPVINGTSPYSANTYKPVAKILVSSLGTMNVFDLTYAATGTVTLRCTFSFANGKVMLRGEVEHITGGSAPNVHIYASEATPIIIEGHTYYEITLYLYLGNVNVSSVANLNIEPLAFTPTKIYITPYARRDQAITEEPPQTIF